MFFSNPEQDKRPTTSEKLESTLVLLIKNTHRIKPIAALEKDSLFSELEKCLIDWPDNQLIIKLTLAFMASTDHIGAGSQFHSLIFRSLHSDSSWENKQGSEWFQVTYPKIKSQDDFSSIRITKNILEKKLPDIPKEYLQSNGYHFLRAAIYFEIQTIEASWSPLFKQSNAAIVIRNAMQRMDSLYDGRDDLRAYDQLVEALENQTSFLGDYFGSPLANAIKQLPGDSLNRVNQMKELTNYRQNTLSYEPPSAAVNCGFGGRG